MVSPDRRKGFGKTGDLAGRGFKERRREMMQSVKGRREVLTELKDIVAPAHTALVVWDVQNALFDRIFNREAFLKNTKRLIETARTRQIPIVYSRITPLPREYESPFRTYMFMKRLGVDDPEKLPQFMTPGTREAEIQEEIAPRGGDFVFDKHTTSIFIGTHFERMMRQRGVKAVLFAGISSEIGIASSARDSANRGFYTVVVGDCVSSQDRVAHDMTLKILERLCIVSESEAIIKAWK
jgi:nicotinamidase-related amidase